MATMAILAELQRRGAAAAAGARARAKGGVHGYMVLGADPWGLGALSPDDATNQIFPSSRIGRSAGHNQAVWDQLRASAAAGKILNAQGGPDYIPGSSQCSASGRGAAAIVLSDISSGAFAVAPFTGPAMPFVDLGAAIIGMFTPLFNHHAQAVKKEQSVLCAAVPAANNYLQIIDQAMNEGKATPQQAMAALQSLLSDFQSQVSSIMHGSDPTSSGECNAACVELSKLRAIVAMKQSAYQDLAARQAPMTSGSGPTAAAPASGSTMTIPQGAPLPDASTNWLGIAALLFGGFLLVRAI